MQISIIYDSSVANAPAGFTTAITDAVNYLDKLFTNPISITIDVGYGEVGGLPHTTIVPLIGVITAIESDAGHHS